jgi:hypothetical protein
MAYVSPQEFMNAPDAGATGLFYGYFKTCITAASPPPKKKTIFQYRIPGVLINDLYLISEIVKSLLLCGPTKRLG